MKKNDAISEAVKVAVQNGIAILVADAPDDFDAPGEGFNYAPLGSSVADLFLKYGSKVGVAMPTGRFVTPR